MAALSVVFAGFVGLVFFVLVSWWLFGWGCCCCFLVGFSSFVLVFLMQFPASLELTEGELQHC